MRQCKVFCIRVCICSLSSENVRASIFCGKSNASLRARPRQIPLCQVCKKQFLSIPVQTDERAAGREWPCLVLRDVGHSIYQRSFGGPQQPCHVDFEPSWGEVMEAGQSKDSVYHGLVRVQDVTWPSHFTTRTRWCEILIHLDPIYWGVGIFTTIHVEFCRIIRFWFLTRKDSERLMAPSMEWHCFVYRCWKFVGHRYPEPLGCVWLERWSGGKFGGPTGPTHRWLVESNWP